MVRFVLAHVEPFPVDVYFCGSELFGLARLEPRIIPLPKFSQGVFARLVQDIQVVVEVVAFDGLAASIPRGSSPGPTSS
jgi:hypothetical protein